MQIGGVVAACIVVLQATAVFFGKGGWTFVLAKATPEAEAWQTALSLIRNVTNETLPPPINSWRINAANGSLVYCLQSTYMRTAYCLQHAHTPHAPEQVFVLVHPVLQALNPHMMLLALACLHLHLTLGTSAPVYASPILLLLVFVAAVIEGLRDSALMQYPTIVVLVAAALAGVWSMRGRDARWRMAAHLQIVCVPVAVLGMAVAGGARLWSDALSYFVLLSAAVNCLWVQNTLRSTPALGLCRAFTIALTLLSLRIADDGFGAYDMWRYPIAYVACAGLAPLVLLSLFPADDSYLYYYQNYYLYVIQRQDVVAKPGAPTYAYHNILLQVCTTLALIGLSANLAFLDTA